MNTPERDSWIDRRILTVEVLDEAVARFINIAGERIEALLKRVEVLEKELAELKGQTFAEPEECRRHTCSYYHDYLAQGPADLTHEGYHAAEKKCEEAQKRVMDHLDRHPGRPLTPALDRWVGRWEQAVRA